MRIIQQPSIATLKPARDESSDFDKTENLFIEGDNLEVLKLLQKSYFGKVKMIYIDPPYNTGKEFIYPDKYAETLDTYLKYTGQIDADGRKFSTNTDAVGRYHSNWLNMMYPRLRLARNLLRDDGVIFISIDDNEQANLKALCEDIFGEENFVAQFIWNNSTGGGLRKKHVNGCHEYILCFAKNIGMLEMLWAPMSEAGISQYKKEDNNGRYREQQFAWQNNSTNPNQIYPIQIPDGYNIIPKPGYIYRFIRSSFDKLLNEGRITFKKTSGSVYLKENGSPTEWSISVKDYLGDAQTAPVTMLPKEYVKMNIEAVNELKTIFDKKVFEYAKPSTLIKYLMSIFCDDNSLVLDFFAGSATTAHAVMQLNAEDGGNRKYICVQLPEPTADDSEAHKAGYKNIADIGKERIRRAAKKIAKEQKPPENNAKPDLGFRVFKLARSNFKLWEGDVKKVKNLQQQLSAHVNHIEKQSTAEDVLYELLLKSGYPLTTTVKKITLAEKDVFSVDDGELLICLDKSLNQEVMDAMADKKPSRIICLDEGFKKNDQLKTNAAHTFKVRAQQEEKEIIFMTV